MDNDQDRTAEDGYSEPRQKPASEVRPRFETLGERIIEQQRLRKTGSVSTSVALASGEILHTALQEDGEPDGPTLATVVKYANNLKQMTQATVAAAKEQGVRSAALHLEVVKKKNEKLAEQSATMTPADTDSAKRGDARGPKRGRRDGGMEL